MSNESPDRSIQADALQRAVDHFNNAGKLHQWQLRFGTDEEKFDREIQSSIAASLIAIAHSLAPDHRAPRG